MYRNLIVDVIFEKD